MTMVLRNPPAPIDEQVAQSVSVPAPSAEHELVTLLRAIAIGFAQVGVPINLEALFVDSNGG